MPTFEFEANGVPYQIDAADETQALAKLQQVLQQKPQTPDGRLLLGRDTRIPMANASEAGKMEEMVPGDPRSAVYRSPELLHARSKHNWSGRYTMTHPVEAARSLASGVPLVGSLTDEIEAGIRSIAGGDYDAILSGIRQSTEEFNRNAPGNATALPIIGGLAAGGALAKAAPAASNTIFGVAPSAASLPVKMAAGATSGGVLGAAHGFGAGEGGFENRLESGKRGGVSGAVLGGAIPVAGQLASLPFRGAIPTSDHFRAAADAAYDVAERANVMINRRAYSRFLNGLRNRLATEGIDEGLHTEALGALRYLERRRGGNITLKGLDLARQNLGDVIASNKPRERYFGGIMRDALDDFVENVRPLDLVASRHVDAQRGIAAYQTARDAWMRMRKLETVERLMHRADIGASKFTQSGRENSIRNEFRTQVKNERKMRGFTPQEREALERVARGTLTGNAMRNVGRFMPNGVVSSLPTIFGTMHFGPEAGAAIAGVGGLARMGATGATMRNVERAAETIGLGGGGRATPEAAAVDELIRLLLQSSAPANASVPVGQRLPPALLGYPVFAQ